MGLLAVAESLDQGHIEQLQTTTHPIDSYACGYELFQLEYPKFTSFLKVSYVSVIKFAYKFEDTVQHIANAASSRIVL
jgi:hypothetical protein